MQPHRACVVMVLPLGVSVCAAGAGVLGGCVPKQDRVEYRQPVDPAVAGAPDAAGPVASADPARQPIRPPTSAILAPAPGTEPAPGSAPETAPGTDPAAVGQPSADAGTGALADGAPADATPGEMIEPVEPMPPATAPDAGQDTPDTPETPVNPDTVGDATPVTPATDDPTDDPDTPDDPEAPAPVDPPLHEAWRAGSAYNALFKPGEVQTVTGDIDAVGTFVPAEDAQPGLLLELKVGEETVAVHGAPLRYLRAIEVRFDFGERLTVAGAWAMVEGKRVLLAQSITRGETRVVLRDAETGRPAWSPPPADPEPEPTEHATPPGRATDAEPAPPPSVDG